MKIESEEDFKPRPTCPCSTKKCPLTSSSLFFFLPPSFFPLPWISAPSPPPVAEMTFYSWRKIEAGGRMRLWVSERQKQRQLTDSRQNTVSASRVTTRISTIKENTNRCSVRPIEGTLNNLTIIPGTWSIQAVLTVQMVRSLLCLVSQKSGL